MGQCIYIREENNPIVSGADTAVLYNIGDLVAYDSGNSVPGASWVWDTNKSTTQTNFATAFLGHCFQYKAAGTAQVYGNSLPNVIGVSSTGTYEADVQSATTFVLGDFVGLAKNPSSNALLSQVVEKVADAAHAVGVVVEEGVDLTRVKFRILSSVTPLSR